MWISEVLKYKKVEVLSNRLTYMKTYLKFILIVNTLKFGKIEKSFKKITMELKSVLLLVTKIQLTETHSMQSRVQGKLKVRPEENKKAFRKRIYI